jgi:hypothetical protein
VCEILGVGPELEGDPDGLRVRTEVDAISDLLTTKYGAATKRDDCIDEAADTGGDDGGKNEGDGEKSDSITCKDFWPQALQAGKAHYTYSWNLSQAPNAGVGLIVLTALAKNALVTYPMVGYFSSTNQSRCEAETKAAEAGSL